MTRGILKQNVAAFLPEHYKHGQEKLKEGIRKII